MNLFGKKKKAAPMPDMKAAIQKLDDTLNLLEKRSAKLEKDKNSILLQAKEKMRNKDKKGALSLMRRKQVIQKQIDGLHAKGENILDQKLALENATVNKTTAESLQSGVDALKATTSG